MLEFCLSVCFTMKYGKSSGWSQKIVREQDLLLKDFLKCISDSRFSRLLVEIGKVHRLLVKSSCKLQCLNSQYSTSIEATDYIFTYGTDCSADTIAT